MRINWIGRNTIETAKHINLAKSCERCCEIHNAILKRVIIQHSMEHVKLNMSRYGGTMVEFCMVALPWHSASFFCPCFNAIDFSFFDEVSRRGKGGKEYTHTFYVSNSSPPFSQNSLRFLLLFFFFFSRMDTRALSRGLDSRIDKRQLIFPDPPPCGVARTKKKGGKKREREVAFP